VTAAARTGDQRERDQEILTVAWGSAIVTVHASVDCRAFHVLGLVLLASDIRDAIVVDPAIGSIGVTTRAGASITTVDQCLDGGENITRFAFCHDLQTISDAAEGSMGPRRR
jgi:hypothetical protein